MAINIEGTLNACLPFTSCCMVPGIMLYDPCYNPCQLRPLRSTFPLNWERFPRESSRVGRRGEERRGRGRGQREREEGEEDGEEGSREAKCIPWISCFHETIKFLSCL